MHSGYGARWKVAHAGMTPRDAIEATGKQMSSWIQQQVQKGIKKYEEAVDATRPLGKEEFVDDLAMTSMARLWDVGKTEPIKVTKSARARRYYSVRRYRQSSSNWLAGQIWLSEITVPQSTVSSAFLKLLDVF